MLGRALSTVFRRRILVEGIDSAVAGDFGMNFKRHNFGFPSGR